MARRSELQVVLNVDVVLHFARGLYRSEGCVLILVAEAPSESAHEVLLLLLGEVMRVSLKAGAGAPRDGSDAWALGAVNEYVWNVLFELFLLFLDSAEVLTDVAAELLSTSQLGGRLEGGLRTPVYQRCHFSPQLVNCLL